MLFRSQKNEIACGERSVPSEICLNRRRISEDRARSVRVDTAASMTGTTRDRWRTLAASDLTTQRHTFYGYCTSSHQNKVTVKSPA